MIANVSEFEVLLTRYEDEPGVCTKLLRGHALADPVTFLSYSQAALLERPASRALKFITGLAISGGMIQNLIRIFSRDRKLAISLAERLIASEPRFDQMLVEYLLHPSPGVSLEESNFQAILEILDQISEGDRLVPTMLKFLKHSNPKIRSKAALFVGSRTQNMAWAANRAQEFDARVRANIIESLFGLNSEFVHHMFRSSVSDENNRVAGNAVFGLYAMGDVTSIPLIYDFVRHTDARFRNTAAWIMGRTGDPRFVHLCLELMNDPDEIVRAQAFKGLGEVRKASRARASLPQLRSSLIAVRRGERENASVTVTDAAGQPVRGIEPIRFVVKSGTPAKPIANFAVEEYDSKSSLHLAFILCLPKDSAEAVGAEFSVALQKVALDRRTKDRWAVLKINEQRTPLRAHPVFAPAPVTQVRRTVFNLSLALPAIAQPSACVLEYSHVPEKVEQMMREKPVTLTKAAEEVDGFIDNLLCVDATTSRPTWVIIGADDDSHFLRSLSERSDNVRATIHVIALSDEWKLNGPGLADRTNGSFQTLADLSKLEKKVSDIHSSLLHHYRVNWTGPTHEVEIEINAEQGYAAVSEDVRDSVVEVPEKNLPRPA